MALMIRLICSEVQIAHIICVGYIADDTSSKGRLGDACALLLVASLARLLLIVVVVLSFVHLLVAKAAKWVVENIV